MGVCGLCPLTKLSSHGGPTSAALSGHFLPVFFPFLHMEWNLLAELLPSHVHIRTSGNVASNNKLQKFEARSSGVSSIASPHQKEPCKVESNNLCEQTLANDPGR